ncbi:MAG TPA: YegS/Rv2252/BmrU family lipid kinase [Methanospirillum sp.]|uniref:diacylglycerol/lipid kinase family protein n=1 Tax=Methanospirillum sp. TaxID=45200 RepID=UPI002CCDF176|nr:YegS/Rv2252/BmrU family lipid kinase [Methanospirillum sp.]HWQ62905.1 YegS/Rv2252/BmrU family lipid kinase [Methanospirillum sp.]
MKSKRELELIIRSEKKAVLIVNTHSRKGEKLFFRAMDLLNQKGIDVIESYPVRKPERMKQIVQDSINKGHSLIIVGGGDGTLNTIMESFVNRDVVLGILPLGTANNFARSMGIPMTLERAVDIIADGKVVDIDLGMINDQYFINIATIGFSRNVISATPRVFKKYLGVLSYLLYEIKYLLSQQLFVCEISNNEVKKRFQTRQLIIANGSFYGTRKISPEAHIDNNTLLIFAMDSMSRWQGLKFWIGFLLGRHLSFPESRLFQVESAYIETVPLKYVILGGEKVARTPIQISVDQAAVKIMAAESFRDHDDILAERSG